MAAYQLTSSGTSIVREVDGAFIPTDPANADFQIYEAWLKAGNTPDPAPVPTPVTQVQAAAFLARFTPTEQIAVQSASLTNPQIAFGLTLGLAQGFVILNSPILSNWMAGLVAAGALTSARSTAIMTP
jgi:hypothetical protein